MASQGLICIELAEDSKEIVKTCLYKNMYSDYTIDMYSDYTIDMSIDDTIDSQILQSLVHKVKVFGNLPSNNASELNEVSRLFAGKESIFHVS